MNQFQDVYGILALVALKEINPQDEEVYEMQNNRDELKGFIGGHIDIVVV